MEKYIKQIFIKMFPKSPILRSWYSWSILTVIFGAIGYDLYIDYVLNNTLLPLGHWLPEIIMALTYLVYFIIGVSMARNQFSTAVMKYRLAGWIMFTVWLLLISARMGQYYMWVSYGSAIFYIVSLRNYSYRVSEKMEIARKQMWLKKNLNEKDWTWGQGAIPEYKGSKKDQSRREKTKNWEWIHGIAPAIGVWVVRYLGLNTALIFIAAIDYYLSMIFFKGIFEFIGILHRLLIWEKIEGKRFLLPSDDFS